MERTERTRPLRFIWIVTGVHVEISSLQMSPHHIPLRILWQIQEVLNPKHKNEKQQQLSINLLKACDQKKKKAGTVVRMTTNLTIRSNANQKIVQDCWKYWKTISLVFCILCTQKYSRKTISASKKLKKFNRYVI